jgi:hypothetical protein
MDTQVVDQQVSRIFSGLVLTERETEIFPRTCPAKMSYFAIEMADQIG